MLSKKKQIYLYQIQIVAVRIIVLKITTLIIKKKFYNTIETIEEGIRKKILGNIYFALFIQIITGVIFMKKLLFISLLFVLFGNNYAESINNRNTIIVVVRYIHDGSITYSYSLKGLQEHLNNLQIQDDMIKTYQALKPIVDKMKSKKRTANVITTVFGVAGIGSIGYGGYVLATEPTLIDNSFNRKKDIGYYLIGGGFLGSVLGFIIPQALCGNFEEEILQYINRYNILHPEKPLEVY